METLKRTILKENFIDYAEKQENALDKGKGKQANVYHKRLWALYNEAKAENCIDVFKECINHPNLNVRIWAAGFIFALDSRLAKSILKAIPIDSDVTIKLSVQAMLESFDNGQWKLLL